MPQAIVWGQQARLYERRSLALPMAPPRAHLKRTRSLDRPRRKDGYAAAHCDDDSDDSDHGLCVGVAADSWVRIGFNYWTSSKATDGFTLLATLLHPSDNRSMAHLASVDDPMSTRWISVEELGMRYQYRARAPEETLFKHFRTCSRMLRTTGHQIPGMPRGGKNERWNRRDAVPSTRDQAGKFMYVRNDATGTSSLSPSSGEMYDEYVYAGESTVFNSQGMWMSTDTGAVIGDPALVGTKAGMDPERSAEWARRTALRIGQMLGNVRACIDTVAYAAWRNRMVVDRKYEQEMKFGSGGRVPLKRQRLLNS